MSGKNCLLPRFLPYLSRQLVAFFPGGGGGGDEYGDGWASGQVVVGAMAGHEHPPGT
jgi:hypothetical protein